MKLTSPAFQNEGPIPRKYTCEGADACPQLAWTDVPSGTRSLALIVDDPDAPDPAAPRRTWVHWVAYDISPKSIGTGPAGELPPGSREGLNDWSRIGWGGPCPPIGRHRYIFKLYALDRAVGAGELHKAELEKLMRGHILAEARLMGTYQKG